MKEALRRVKEVFPLAKVVVDSFHVFLTYLHNFNYILTLLENQKN